MFHFSNSLNPLSNNHFKINDIPQTSTKTLQKIAKNGTPPITDDKSPVGQQQSKDVDEQLAHGWTGRQTARNELIWESFVRDTRAFCRSWTKNDGRKSRAKDVERQKSFKKGTGVFRWGFESLF